MSYPIPSPPVNDCTPIELENENQQNDNAIQNNKSDIAKYKQKIKKFVFENKKLYEYFMNYLENSDDDEYCLQEIIKSIKKFKYEGNKKKFEEFLRLISCILTNYHRKESLYTKIFKLLQYYRDQIKQIFSNLEIFNIFQNNKLILIYLFKNQIITFDDDIYKEIMSKIESNGIRYCHFFYPEVKKFVGEEKVKDIENELLLLNPKIFENFDEKRHEGENDSYICSLIRKDSVEEFIIYVNQTNISLKSEIITSLFETNSFLIENQRTSLIEYSAFFGSIQIFNYLRMNNVDLNPSLWLYAIHSQNAEFIHLLESCNVELPNDKYEECFIESIKCHHNDFAEYFKNNYLPQDEGILKKNEKIYSNILKYHNYAYFNLCSGKCCFYYLCSYGYNIFVKAYFKKNRNKTKEKINEKVLFNYFF